MMHSYERNAESSLAQVGMNEKLHRIFTVALVVCTERCRMYQQQGISILLQYMAVGDNTQQRRTIELRLSREQQQRQKMYQQPHTELNIN